MSGDLVPVYDVEVLEDAGDHSPATIDRTPAAVDINHTHTPGAAERLANAGRANTRDTYQTQWDQFARWCVDNGRDPRVPTTSYNMAGYVDHIISKGAPPSSVRLAIAAVRWMNARSGHPDKPELVDSLTMYRDHRYETSRSGGAQRSSAPITMDRLQRMLAACDPDSLTGQRDRLLLLLGYQTRARASELAGYRVADARFMAPDLAVVTKRVSKNDKNSSGREYDIKDPETLAALQAWRTVLKDHGQDAPHLPLLRGVDQWGNLRPIGKTGAGLTRQAINLLVKQIAERAGVADEVEALTAHGLRAGVPTDLGMLGMAASEIREITEGDWSSDEMVERYRKTGARLSGKSGQAAHRARALDMLRTDMPAPIERVKEQRNGETV